MAISLLGPPEIHQAPPSSAPAAAPQPSSSSFVDLMDAEFNAAIPRPPMGLTENLSPTFLASGDPCLDFFFQVVPDTPAPTVESLLSAAWDQDKDTALKLACHLRGVRGTGKSDREGFYTSALWLHSHHPKTLALNLKAIAGFGYLKDFPEILYRLLAGADVREKAKAERPPRGRKSRTFRWRRPVCQRRTKDKGRKQKKEGTSEERISADLAKGRALSAQAAELRHKKRSGMSRRGLDRYNRDPDYRFLHDRVTDLFVDLLNGDLQNLSAGNLTKISLAAKWCPSLDTTFDLSTLLCEAIARRLFPRSSDPEYESIPEAHYAYRVRDRLRKAVLVPLRRALELPEVYMGARQWSILPYNRVASVAMKNYKEIFMKHDAERFTKYLESVKKGEAKIAAGALLPHEIIAEAGNEVAELQWKRMVDDLAKKGSLQNCISVCDVSGSMSGKPMEVCVALGLLISELTEEPWKGRLITFSENPNLFRIHGETLAEKTEFIRQMEWGMNTDFQKVFDKMLEVAVQGKLAPERMVKRVFVFSDMEFDEASARPWETDYEAICRKYRESGYGSSVPEVVFWNLSDSRATPVPSTQKGVALVSGFSKNLVKVFIDGGGVVSPRAVMEKAIAGKEYEKLVVFD